MAIYPLNLRPNLLHSLQKDIGIPHIREILHNYRFIRHNRRRKNGQSRILSSTNLNFAYQWVSAFYHILIHY